MYVCRCASLDGDADRAVFFTKVDDSMVLLDGDKIAALAAIHIKDLLAKNPRFNDELTVWWWWCLLACLFSSCLSSFLKKTNKHITNY